MTASSNWDGLRALWSVIKRIVAALALGVMGAVIAGFTGGLLTICAYGFGMMFTAPIGFGLGVVMSRRMAVRDIAIAFVGMAGVFLLFRGNQPSGSPDDLVYWIVGIAVGCLSGMALLWIMPRYVPPATRYWLAVGLSLSFVVTTFVAFILAVYRV